MNNISAIITVNTRERGEHSFLHFSHAEDLSTRVDSQRLHFKDKGNEALKAKNPLLAARFYLKGVAIATLSPLQQFESNEIW